MARKKATSTIETRTFRAHDHLILDVIMRQAGTLSKAIAEGIQNSDDAGATEVDILLTSTKLAIVDNGKGFETAEQIIEVFEVFGHPHDRDEQGISTDAKYGTFRIGRGQLFAFGANVWRTNSFQMSADVKARQLEYDLESELPEERGCCVRVNLYDSLKMADIARTVEEVENLCRFMTLKVVINGRRITMDANSLKWDYKDETCQMRVKAEKGYTGIEIYNKGVFVERMNSWQIGMSGLILVHDTMLLNFARNQVIRTCKIWKRVIEKARQVACVAAENKRLTKSEAAGILRTALRGEDAGDILRIKCIPDIRGKMWSPDLLFYPRRSYRDVQIKLTNLAFEQTGDRAGDLVMQLEKGVVIDDDVLNHLLVPSTMSRDEKIQEFLKGMDRVIGGDHTKAVKLFPSARAILGPNFSMEHRILQVKELTDREKMWLNAAQSAYRSLCYALRRGFEEKHVRSICLGDSATADGWTDGESMIAVGRQFLKRHNLGTETGWLQVALLLCHEQSHTEIDTAAHNHTFDFYHNYHEMSRYAAPAGRQAFMLYRKLIMNDLTIKREGGKRVNNKQLLRELNLRVETYIAQQIYDETNPI